ncbi:hypothetical protein [Carboxylicivirga sp. RSCT41]|uniref:hypothetical protein n=1 Tax=Carboxylicivirga agarovorans TaxID=3417570 RepID=UPI003D32F4EE
MIVGLLTLLSLLFFGGSTESYYLVEDLDKASKIYVVDKDRQKAIISRLKSEKKVANAYYKERSKNLKKFKSILIDPDASKEELASFFVKQIESVENHQKLVFKTRLDVLKNIEQDEWEKIVEYSENKAKKIKDKAKRKLEIKSNPWNDLQKLVDKTIINERNHKAVSQELELLRRNFKKMSDAITERNVQDNEIIRNYHSDIDALWSIGHDMNEIRTQTYQSVVLFREQIKNRTTDDEFTKIMKAIYKTVI